MELNSFWFLSLFVFNPRWVSRPLFGIPLRFFLGFSFSPSLPILARASGSHRRQLWSLDGFFVDSRQIIVPYWSADSLRFSIQRLVCGILLGLQRSCYRSSCFIHEEDFFMIHISRDSCRNSKALRASSFICFRILMDSVDILFRIVWDYWHCGGLFSDPFRMLWIFSVSQPLKNFQRIWSPFLYYQLGRIPQNPTRMTLKRIVLPKSQRILTTRVEIPKKAFYHESLKNPPGITKKKRIHKKNPAAANAVASCLFINVVAAVSVISILWITSI